MKNTGYIIQFKLFQDKDIWVDYSLFGYSSLVACKALFDVIKQDSVNLELRIIYREIVYKERVVK